MICQDFTQYPLKLSSLHGFARLAIFHKCSKFLQKGLRTTAHR